MKTGSVKSLIVSFVLLLSIVVSACQPVVMAEMEAAEEGSMKALEEAQNASEEESPELATAMVSAQFSNQAGRAIVTARGNHFESAPVSFPRHDGTGGCR